VTSTKSPECGVKLLGWRDHSPTSRRPRECFCKPTMRDIGRRHGEDHLRLVLMLLTGTEENAGELYADVLKAVSRLLAGHPELVRRRSLVEDFNALDIGALRQAAKDMRCGVPTSDVLLVILTIQFGIGIVIGEAA
jgi:hypothetical protein